jgi:hypothetical protein
MEFKPLKCKQGTCKVRNQKYCRFKMLIGVSFCIRILLKDKYLIPIMIINEILKS